MANREGFNDPIEGAKCFLQLVQEIGELENHVCEDREFHPCYPCKEISKRMHEMNEISSQWSRQWAQELLRSIGTLPSQVWCECGHISGQHGAYYPHPCATGGNDGCENGCKRFTPSQTPRCVCGEIQANPCHSADWCLSGIVGAHAFTPKANQDIKERKAP